jgi:hypothetical protein
VANRKNTAPQGEGGSPRGGSKVRHNRKGHDPELDQWLDESAKKTRRKRKDFEPILARKIDTNVRKNDIDAAFKTYRKLKTLIRAGTPPEELPIVMQLNCKKAFAAAVILDSARKSKNKKRPLPRTGRRGAHPGPFALLAPLFILLVQAGMSVSESRKAIRLHRNRPAGATAVLDERSITIDALTRNVQRCRTVSDKQASQASYAFIKKLKSDPEGNTPNRNFFDPIEKLLTH